MKLNELKPARGAKRKRIRVGRGIGSGLGKTSGRGHKGAGQRSGTRIKRAYEGGQNPLVRRLPKRGFVSRNRVQVQIVNVEQLRRFESGATVDREALFKSRAIASLKHPVKVLGDGKIDVPLKLKVEAISEAARKKIEGAGGSVEILKAVEPKPAEQPAS